jgi:RHS repeat-associated protein
VRSAIPQPHKGIPRLASELSAQTCAGVYSFTFQGKETDNEMHGATGTSYDFGARMYDPRVARWLAIDPLALKYADLTPFQFVANSPLVLTDPDGERIQGVKFNSKTGEIKYTKSAIRRGTDKYIAARMQTRTGELRIIEMIEDRQTVKVSVTSNLMISGSQPEPGKFALVDGESLAGRGEGIAVSTSLVPSSDIYVGDPEDLLMVDVLGNNGELETVTIRRGDLVPPKKDPNNEVYQAYRDSGIEAYEEANPIETVEEKIHATGAHEETHWFEEDPNGMSDRDSERGAYDQELIERRQYEGRNDIACPDEE